MSNTGGLYGRPMGLNFQFWKRKITSSNNRVTFKDEKKDYNDADTDDSAESQFGGKRDKKKEKIIEW